MCIVLRLSAITRQIPDQYETALNKGNITQTYFFLEPKQTVPSKEQAYVCIPFGFYIKMIRSSRIVCFSKILYRLIGELIMSGV